MKTMLAEHETIKYTDGGGFRAMFTSEKSGFWHFHPEVEIVLNLKSYGTRIIGDSVELFDKYDLTIIAGNLPHSWNHYRQKGGIPDRHGIVCHFHRDSFGKQFLAQHEMKDISILLEKAERGIAFSETDARKAEPIMREMVAQTGSKKMISLFKLLDHMVSAEKRRALTSEGYRHAYDERGNRRMAEVYKYIRENYSGKITLVQLSGIANMTPFAFSRFFKKCSGAGVVEYINQVRTNKACYLLRETDEQVSEISTDCGFHSISNFNKQFRKYTTITPREYRERYR